jgi:ubiquinone/menaquinone biosynthesis C-methylase UbiE
MYDKRYREIQRRKYEAVLANIPRTNKILDIGCGTGMLLSLLGGRAELVIGIDFSPEMLQKARRRATGAPLVLADADHLPFIDGSFDVVVSITLLQNMPNPAATLREFARVLKSNGTAIITSLKYKHSPQQLAAWAASANLKPLKVGGTSNGEDVICIARRE